MHIYAMIRGIGFRWALFNPDFATSSLIVFHLSFYWRDYQPKRLWELAQDKAYSNNLVYTDIRNKKQSRWMLQNPIRFEQMDLR
jgi:hypothetical protein